VIVLVDDDKAILEIVKEILSVEGYHVVAFESSQKAFENVSKEEPGLVIADVLMPEMGGFEFKEAYSMLFPNRQTPFIFLSSHSDTDTIVHGLDLGADDYLIKPVNAEVLKAKVRSILSRKKRYSVPVFHGDLSKLPFVKILQFCESKALTGEVEISSGASILMLQIRRGDLVLENLDDSVLEQLYDRMEGRFVIYSQPVDFHDIEDAALREPPKPVPRLSDREKPMGRLSGVTAKNMLFQVQTEFVTHPSDQVVTIVILDGRVVLKRTKLAPPDKTERKALEKMIEEMHVSVEKEINEKINDLIRKKTESKDTIKEKFTRLFEDGFDKYRERDYIKALELWEAAYALNPADKILETNISILRKKLKHD